MRTILVGTVESTQVALETLVADGQAPAMLVTLRPDLAKRHSDFVDLHPLARAHGIAVLHVSNINAPEVIETIAATDPDLALVVGWSQICREPFRCVARMGAIGFHPSLLPRMRGRAVIPWTILEDVRETGATLLWLDEGTDTGDIVLQERFAVAPDMTARQLYDRHLQALRSMLPKAVRLAAEDRAPRKAQDCAQASYCAKRMAEDGRIDWHAPAKETLRLIRAVGDPYPGAFTEQDDAKIIVEAAESVPHSSRYIGLTGQVQHVDDLGVMVRCGDGACIAIRRWRSDSPSRIRLHSILGRILK